MGDVTMVQDESQTILVTGGAGYVGSHMVWSLFELGYTPVVIDNLSTGRASNLPASVELIVGNAGDKALVLEILRSRKIKSVVHFAGSLSVEESVRDPLKYYTNNSVNTANLIEACAKAGVQNFIFSSTAAVYGQHESYIVKEDSELKPLSPYGESKRIAETIVRDSSRALNFRVACLRYFNVAGVHPRMRSGPRSTETMQLIRRACLAALGVIPSLEIFGDDYSTPDGTCIRDFIHVADLVDAHIAAMKHLMSGGESLTLNCGYGLGCSVKQVVDMVERVAQTRLDLQIKPRRPGDISAIIADTSLLRSKLPAWQPIFGDLRDIVSSTLAWERKLLSQPSGVESVLPANAEAPGLHAESNS